MSLLAVVSHLSTFPCHSLALTVSPLQENGWIPTTTKLAHWQEREGQS